MKTIQINLFKFDELTEEAKDNAIQSYREKYPDNQFYYDEITETVKKSCRPVQFGIWPGIYRR